MSQAPSNDDNPVQEPQPAMAESNELEKLRRERDDLYERLARATADFQNTRKRLQQEAEQGRQFANSQLIKALLPVLDNFERALAVDPAKTDVPSILKGMELVHAQWNNILKAQDVEVIAPSVGELFDPTRHEALMQQPADYAQPTVVQLLSKGYAMHGRTLRPAQVVVSKPKE
jgi:molecular chaperone GrpE